MQNVIKLGVLTKKLGSKRASQQQFVITNLEEEHLEQIMGLQQVVLQNLSRPELMASISYDFMQEHIKRKGFILGAFIDGHLVAFRIVYFPQSTDQEFNMGFDIGLSTEQRTRVANLQMVCVHPDFRGNALGSKMNRIALDLLKEQQTCEHVFASVSPHNIWNIRVLLDCGFCIVALKFKYGGKLRYIVYQNLYKPMEFADDQVVYTGLENLNNQKKLFHSGRYGVALAQMQELDGGLKKNLLIHNRVVFKRPVDQQAAPFIKRVPNTAENKRIAGARTYRHED